MNSDDQCIQVRISIQFNKKKLDYIHGSYFIIDELKV